VLLTVVPPDAIAALARLLADRAVPGINALTADAQKFAAAWGRPYRTGLQTRLYRLAELTPPDPGPPGAARIATTDDRPLLLEWLEAFHTDIDQPRRDVADQVDDKLSYGGWRLWEVDGRPVALAGLTRPEAGMVRVVAVYTPPDLRGRGYGGAATVAVTRAALDAGADDVVLFTDQANATSNALYQRLGYRPVEDRSVLEFEP
jgi:predicted GNAT family acetyltransferase